MSDLLAWLQTGDVKNYLFAICYFLLTLFVLKTIQLVLVKRVKKITAKTTTDIDDKILAALTNIKPTFYILTALFVAIQRIDLPTIAVKVVTITFALVVSYEVIRIIQEFIEYGITKYAKVSDDQDEEQTIALARSLRVVIVIILWAIAITITLSNIGVDVTSLVASLGIGGIAVALAVQNILGDVLSSFSIFTDKPFKVGDFIVVGSDTGTVEKIGLKTTRLRSLDGQQLIISNNELTSSRIQNFELLEKRRVLMKLGVLYETDEKALKQIPFELQKIVQEVSMATFDRCHFTNFADSALEFELVYFVSTKVYAEYLDVKQEVNFNILERFKELEIGFAYPTQTIYVEK